MESADSGFGEVGDGVGDAMEEVNRHTAEGTQDIMRGTMGC